MGRLEAVLPWLPARARALGQLAVRRRRGDRPRLDARRAARAPAASGRAAGLRRLRGLVELRRAARRARPRRRPHAPLVGRPAAPAASGRWRSACRTSRRGSPPPPRSPRSCHALVAWADPAAAAGRPRPLRPEPLGRRPLRRRGRPRPPGGRRLCAAGAPGRAPGPRRADRRRLGGASSWAGSTASTRRASSSRSGAATGFARCASGWWRSRTMGCGGRSVGDDAGERDPLRALCAAARRSARGARRARVRQREPARRGHARLGRRAASGARRSSRRSTARASASSPPDRRRNSCREQGVSLLVSDGWQRPKPTPAAWRPRPVTASASRRKCSSWQTRSTGSRDASCRAARRPRISSRRPTPAPFAAGAPTPRGRTSGPGSCAS